MDKALTLANNKKFNISIGVVLIAFHIALIIFLIVFGWFGFLKNYAISKTEIDWKKAGPFFAFIGTTIILLLIKFLCSTIEMNKNEHDIKSKLIFIFELLDMAILFVVGIATAADPELSCGLPIWLLPFSFASFIVSIGLTFYFVYKK